MKACGAPLWEQKVPLAILSSSNTTIMSNPLPQCVGFVFTHDCVSILDNMLRELVVPHIFARFSQIIWSCPPTDCVSFG